MIEPESVYTEEQCATCGHVFGHYLDAGPDRNESKRKRATIGSAQSLCPNCRRPVFVNLVRFPASSKST